MSHVRLLYSTSRHPLSGVIRACTWSRWSHVALVDGDRIIEATWPRVREYPLAMALAHAADHELVTLPCVDVGTVIDAAASQIGKPYDWTALLGMGIHRDWQREDRWFCSELVAWAFEQAGQPLFRRDLVSRVTPQNLWMLAPVEAVQPNAVYSQP